MKTYKKIAGLLVIVLFTACHDIMDIENREAINPGDVFQKDYMAEAYVNDIYGRMMPGWPSGSDLAAESDEFNRKVSVLFRGDAADINVAGNTFDIYNKIRRLNEFFVGMQESPIADETKKTLEAQIYFWRAWAYFDLVRVHGGVPLILTPQELTDDLMVTRNSTTECVDQIIADLDAAIADLPVSWGADDYGRITKGAAMAFKGRVMLHMASPQWKIVSWADANQATKAAKDHLEANGYTLFKGSKYDDIWFDEMNSGVVMVHRYDPSASPNSRDAWLRPFAWTSKSIGTYGNIPQLELVNAFPMKDGMAYDPAKNLEGLYWKDRDPRFYTNFSYHGDALGLPEMEGLKLWIINSNAGGTDGSKTGFFCKKGVDVSLTVPELTKGEVDWPEIRMAEVLLNYAETANETGDGAAAFGILKQIRERAGIENNDGRYGVPAGVENDKDAMTEAILTERKIEFAFEGKRAWDLRRRMLYEEEFNGKKRTGLIIKAKNPGSQEWIDFEANTGDVQKTANISDPDILNLFKFEIVERDEMTLDWAARNYYLPIAKKYIDQNTNIQQTTGWGGNFDPLK